ncbi:MAG TPA: hypothetical protein VFK34_00615 [Marmoricola sp.]|nr:hypothetical protein [Marmoricola sp.]
MFINRSFFRTTAVAAVVALTAGTPALVGSAEAAKRPTKPGKFSISSLAVAPPAYTFTASWTAASNTTRYAVRLADTTKGTTLANVNVAAPATAWDAFAGLDKAAAGDTVTLTVTPFNGTVKGAPRSRTVVLKDITAPTGSITAAKVDPTDDLTWKVTGTATDDVSTGADISGVISWGDGSSEAWSAETGAQHTYEDVVEGARYVPSIVLTDKAQNASAPIEVPSAVVINDANAPTAAYSNRTSAWASYNRVTLTESGYSDQFSPSDHATRTVDWGDGTAETVVVGTGALSHIYRTTGQQTFTPTVTLTDEAGNVSAPIAATPVVVTQDTAGPRVTLRLPLTARNSVRKWTTLRGTVKDAGVGARTVRVRAVEKRGSYYYAYKPGLRRWVRTGVRLSYAFQRAGVQYVKPSSTGAWSARLARLTRGTLTYRVNAIDKVNNVGRTVAHTAKLTRS